MILHYSDDELIEGLRHKKQRCIEYMYEEFGLLSRKSWEDRGKSRDDSSIIVCLLFLQNDEKLECWGD